jgi:hypothetical protein
MKQSSESEPNLTSMLESVTNLPRNGTADMKQLTDLMEKMTAMAAKLEEFKGNAKSNAESASRDATAQIRDLKAFLDELQRIV